MGPAPGLISVALAPFVPPGFVPCPRILPLRTALQFRFASGGPARGFRHRGEGIALGRRRSGSIRSRRAGRGAAEEAIEERLAKATQAADEPHGEIAGHIRAAAHARRSGHRGDVKCVTVIGLVPLPRRSAFRSGLLLRREFTGAPASALRARESQRVAPPARGAPRQGRGDTVT